MRKHFESEIGIEQKPIWQMNIKELKAIIDNFVGNFEKELNKRKENIPNSLQGQYKAVQDGKLPNCGMYWLRDRGITKWYLENGWIATWRDGKKRHWALTEKYSEERIPEKENALEELIGRRQYVKKKEAEAIEQII